MAQNIAVPGQILDPASKLVSGTGTHVYNSYICASLAGAITSSAHEPHSLSVTQPGQALPTLPSVSSTVLARITRLTPRQANTSILAINNRPCSYPFTGLIRAQDVRVTQKDTVKLNEAFRVGDIVRGVVISLGDQGGYYLSTAGNDLGVVMAWSEEGRVLVPVSWKEMGDLETGAREARKVAKPV